MEFIWLYSLCQCILSVSVILVSVRLCMAISSSSKVADVQERTQIRPGSVSCCLRLCLGWVGAVGGAVGVPVTVILNMQSAQCLYTCIILVGCPMLVRHFTMFLLMLLTLDTHLQHLMGDRYSLVITRQRALCVVLLCWVGSVLSSFAQFIGSDIDAWRSGWSGPGTAGLGLHGNWTTSLPVITPFTPPKYLHDRKVIAKHLPYGGFLSKFYVEDMHNFTYAEIHSSHWGVCTPDNILSPQYLVYVHGVTVFVLPFLCLLAIYLDLLCVKSRKASLSHADPTKTDSCQVQSLALSLSLLVLLCLPIHIIHALILFTTCTNVPAWAHTTASVLFQLYGLVPQILFTPPKKQVGEEQPSCPLSVPHLLPTVPVSRAKSVHKALCEAVQVSPWSSAKQSLKAKVCSEV